RSNPARRRSRFQKCGPTKDGGCCAPAPAGAPRQTRQIRFPARSPRRYKRRRYRREKDALLLLQGRFREKAQLPTRRIRAFALRRFRGLSKAPDDHHWNIRICGYSHQRCREITSRTFPEACCCTNGGLEARVLRQAIRCFRMQPTIAELERCCWPSRLPPLLQQRAVPVPEWLLIRRRALQNEWSPSATLQKFLFR